MQWESGVHRVQRVPVNDVKLQTSAATVAVLADQKAEVYGDGAAFPPQVTAHCRPPAVAPLIMRLSSQQRVC